MRQANMQARRRLVVVALTAAVIFAAPAVALAAGEMSTTVLSLPMGVQVAGLAVGAGAVWVANGRAGTVSRIDPRTNQIVATIPVAQPSPTCDRCWGAVAARGDVVWAAMDAAGPGVVHIDPVSNELAETVEVGVLPSALAVDEAGALWLTATLENTVLRVDPHVPGAVARTAVHLPSGIVAGQEAIWVTARKPGANGQVVRIDPRTGVVLATIPVGRDPGVLAAGDHDVWVANEGDHTISRIDPRTNSVTATIPVVHFPVGIAIGEGAVWVASRGSALVSLPTVSRIDPVASLVVETTTIEGAAPIAMGAGQDSLWVASRNPDEVVRMGPVPLSAGVPPDSGLPLPPIVFGAATILLLAAAAAHKRSANRDSERPVPTGRLLRALLLRRQASLRAGGHEWPSGAR